MPLLEIRNLSVSFDTSAGEFFAVKGIDLHVESREVLAIVGESGSGKSVAMLAVMGLLPPSATVKADRMTFEDIDLLGLSDADRRRVIGRDIAMIFQEPMASLNPCFTVGFQIEEMLGQHTDLDSRQRRLRAIELLELVGIGDPAERLKSFPHQMSGGQCQRVMIAMATACNPKLLIADEPTTALDVTIQAQIIDLLRSVQAERRMAMIFVTHDLKLVGKIADRVAVMYASQVVEEGKVTDVLANPRHPYTRALLDCIPSRRDAAGNRHTLQPIPGTMPNPLALPQGCLFSKRCRHVEPRCTEARPPLIPVSPDHVSRCIRAEELSL